MACNKTAAIPKCYVVRFEGSNLKTWDGKEAWLNAKVLDELYDEKLVHGSSITVL